MTTYRSGETHPNRQVRVNGFTPFPSVNAGLWVLDPSIPVDGWSGSQLEGPDLLFPSSPGETVYVHVDESNVVIGATSSPIPGRHTIEPQDWIDEWWWVWPERLENYVWYFFE